MLKDVLRNPEEGIGNPERLNLETFNEKEEKAVLQYLQIIAEKTKTLQKAGIEERQRRPS